MVSAILYVVPGSSMERKDGAEDCAGNLLSGSVAGDNFSDKADYGGEL
jgi:hypothetical protein